MQVPCEYPGAGHLLQSKDRSEAEIRKTTDPMCRRTKAFRSRQYLLSTSGITAAEVYHIQLGTHNNYDVNYGVRINSTKCLRNPNYHVPYLSFCGG